MGNLAFTNSVLEPVDERTSNVLTHLKHAGHLPLALVTKPVFVAQPVPEESLLSRLGGNLRDAFFPRRLPPLELASHPIPVADPLAVRRDPWSSALSFVLHGAVLALVVWFLMQARKQIVAPVHVQVVTPIEFKPFIPITAPVPRSMGGGGGGGARQLVQASKGHLPPVAKVQMAPVEVLKVDHPKLAAAPTVAVPPQVKLPTNNMPNFGDAQAPQIALVSQGTGSGGGFGQRKGGGRCPACFK